VNNSIVVNNYFGSSNSPYNIAGSVDPASADNLIGPGARVGINGGILTGFGGLQNGVNGNQLGVTDPGLAPLGNYGGPTQTMALLPGGPGIGAGSVALAVDGNGNPLATDQRGPGFPRMVNGTVDVGAFEALNPVQDLQRAISAEVQANPAAPTLTIGIPDDSHAQDAVNAIDGLDPQNTPPITLVLNLAPGTYSGQTVSAPSDMTLIINGSANSQLPTTVDPATPAFAVQSGHVTVNNVTFTESGAAPTIQVTGGSLTLRDDVVQSSTGFAEPAIAVSGASTVDLGTAASPGGNTIVVNGAGQVLQSTGVNFVTAVGNTFQANGAAAFPVATVAVGSSANPSLLNQPVTFTATVSAPNAGAAAPTGTVTFVDTTTGTTLKTVSLSGGTAQWSTAALPVNAQTIAAVYSGDANYITSIATLVQAVQYHFSGFRPPLNANLAFAAGRAVPIKFQPTDYKGNSISSLSAVTSLQVLNAQGVNVLTSAGSTALRYDPTANQFVANWQTKGLPAGTYTVQLKLADGTTQTKALQLTANGSGANAQAADGSDVSAGGTSGQLLGGDLEVYVNNGNGALTADELARIQDAITAVGAVVAPYGVTVEETTDPTQAEVTLDVASTSPVGGYANGILGCFDPAAGQITMIQGWNWYAGADPTQIGANQYDFETTVTHELGHALGLGESADPTSAMSGTLAPGTANRTLMTADLNIPYDEAGADAQRAAPATVASTSPAPSPEETPTTSVQLAVPANGLKGVLQSPQMNRAEVNPVELPGAAPAGGPPLNRQPDGAAAVGLLAAGGNVSLPIVPGAPVTRDSQPAAAGADVPPDDEGREANSPPIPSGPADPSLPDDPEPAGQLANRAALSRASAGWRPEPSASAADGFFHAVGRWAGGLIHPGTDGGQADRPGPRDVAAAGPLLAALLGSTWAERDEEADSRRVRRPRRG
jgi:hypothetical protein